MMLMLSSQLPLPRRHLPVPFLSLSPRLLESQPEGINESVTRRLLLHPSCRHQADGARSHHLAVRDHRSSVLRLVQASTSLGAVGGDRPIWVHRFSVLHLAQVSTSLAAVDGDRLTWDEPEPPLLALIRQSLRPALIRSQLFTLGVIQS